MKKAMILAAGRGERMGHLTAHTPKPLLQAGGKMLIEYAISSIRQAGIHEIVINVCYQGRRIQEVLGNGSRYGVNIIYSEESERLETGGGIFQALPHLGSDPFLVVSSDVVTDFPLSSLPSQPEDLAHLVMVENPSYHPEGDFGLSGGKIDIQAVPSLTFANIGVYRPELFSGCSAGHFRLSTILKPAILAGKVTGELYHGNWHNIGTPDDLAEFEAVVGKSVSS